MGRASGWPLVRWLLGVGVPLLSGLLLAPALAHASCGDYVVLGSMPGGQAGHRNPLSLQPTALHARAHLPLLPPPCSGPECSRGKLPPLLPVASGSVPVEQWACLLPANLDPKTEVPFGLPDSACARPVRLASSIFHPPRPCDSHVSL
jgi:hypothetical protein